MRRFALVRRSTAKKRHLYAGADSRHIFAPADLTACGQRITGGSVRSWSDQASDIDCTDCLIAEIRRAPVKKAPHA